jgi:hypothetical protein
MPKFRDYFRNMLSEYEADFAAFKKVHDDYKINQKKWQEEYNKQGEKIVEIIRQTESKLCGTMEKGENAKFSGRLSEKFWSEVRAFFPMIDYVGAQIS